MDLLAIGLFSLSAIALLGSPGPAIAALIAVGRSQGFASGFRYYVGLQFGLAAAAGATAAGLFSMLKAIPSALEVLTVLATAYLIFLAYKIATAPVGATPTGMAIERAPAASTARAGFVLGVTNPKAFVAFASLFASRTLMHANPQGDIALKWTLCVLVMIVVDLAWLFVGVVLNRASLSAGKERALNICLAMAILVAALFALRF
ncbi:MAG: LysE family transporter [Rhodanobacter sp.]